MADTDVDLILFGIRAQLDYCVQLNIRCERRKNELQHRQNLLFKEITDALKKYESIGGNRRIRKKSYAKLTVFS